MPLGSDRKIKQLEIMKKFAFEFICISLTLLTSCSTYHLSTQSLLEQFADSRTVNKVNYLIVAPFVFFPGIVKGNDLETILCLDKTGKEKVIFITHRTGIRITKMDNSHTTFYFDTLLLKDSIITGTKTHFANIPIKPVKLIEIFKIEIQE